MMRKALQKIIPDDKIDELLTISREETVKANVYFIREGEVPNKFAFVISGLFRYVYINEKGYEFTKGIITEHNFLSSYSAMICNSPSLFL